MEIFQFVLILFAIIGWVASGGLCFAFLCFEFDDFLILSPQKKVSVFCMYILICALGPMLWVLMLGYMIYNELRGKH